METKWEITSCTAPAISSSSSAHASSHLAKSIEWKCFCRSFPLVFAPATDPILSIHFHFSHLRQKASSLHNKCSRLSDRIFLNLSFHVHIMPFLFLRMRPFRSRQPMGKLNRNLFQSSIRRFALPCAPS